MLLEIILTVDSIEIIYKAFCDAVEKGLSSLDFSLLPALGGMRPKVILQKESALYIAKFSEKHDKYNNPRIEYATMNLAQNCGLYIAEHDIIAYDSHDVYLTKMFDKEYYNGKFYSKCLLTGLSCMQITDREYGEFSYLKMAQNTYAVQEIFTQANVSLRDRNFFRNTFEQGNIFLEEISKNINGQKI